MLTWYIVSNGKVLAEYDGLTKALHYKYIYAGDQRVAMRDGVNRLHYYLNDHLGSARVVIDSTGTINLDSSSRRNEAERNRDQEDGFPPARE